MTIATRINPRQRLMTTAEYLALPTDDERTELIYGEVAVSPGATWEHNDLIYYLRHLLGQWTLQFTLGRVCFDVDMVLSASRNLIYRPDLLFLTEEHLARRRRGRI